MRNVRKELQVLVIKAQQLHKKERSASVSSVLLIKELERRNAAVNLGMSSEVFAKYIGLTINQYWKRAQAARVIMRFPEALAMLEAGEAEISHLALISPRITGCNQKILLEGIKGKSKREVEGFISRVTKDGRILDEEPELELRLKLTKSQMELLERAREVLAHGGHVPSLPDILSEALDALLDKRDPIRKAKRAAERQEKKAPAPSPGQKVGGVKLSEPASPGKRPRTGRPAIPAAIKHAVWLRDRGQCTWPYSDGQRCPERMMLELDHLKMWCRGGEHSISNLTLRCRRHNQFAAEQVLGVLPRGREQLPHTFVIN